MPLTREQKQNILKDLTDKFNRAKTAILVDFNKLSVAKVMELRRSLKQVDSEYKVAKKTLISRILKLGHYEGIDLDSLKTQVGVIFGYADPVASAQATYKFSNKFSKANEIFKILGGFVGSLWNDKSKIIELAKLPPREILLGRLVGAIAAPLSGLVGVLSGNMRNLVSVINNIGSKRS